MKKSLVAAAALCCINSTPIHASDNFEILQDKNDGVIMGEHYLPTNTNTVIWGRLPNKDTKPVISIKSGSTITIDTLSHEGQLEDQGKDPLKYLKSAFICWN